MTSQSTTGFDPAFWDDEVDRYCMSLAYAEAEQGRVEGGVPIGAVIVIPQEDQGQVDSGTVKAKIKVLGAGHNQRIQRGSPTLHGETAALENAGRLPPETYRKAVLYTTLSPCSMCSGAILLYRIPRVVIGENTTLLGEEELLRSRGVELVLMKDERCRKIMKEYVEEHPEEWYEDIGGED